MSNLDFEMINPPNQNLSSFHRQRKSIMILNSDQKRINSKIDENRKFDNFGLFLSLNPPPYPLIKAHIRRS